MTLRRWYEWMTRQDDPLDLESVSAVEALAALMRSRPVAERIVRYLATRPGALDLTPGEIAQELESLPGVGPAGAALFVMLEVYAGRRLELPEAPADAPRRRADDRRPPG